MGSFALGIWGDWLKGMRCDEILGQGHRNIGEGVPDDFYMHHY